VILPFSLLCHLLLLQTLQHQAVKWEYKAEVTLAHYSSILAIRAPIKASKGLVMAGQ
jgi:hypothetical protein